MSNAEDILNAVRKMPLHRALRACFLNRALKTYCKRIAVADVETLAQAYVGVPAADLKRAARYVVSRLEAAGSRGLRLDDDALMADMALHAGNRDLVRRVMLRGVCTYAKHIGHMPAERVRHSLRGIEASQWQAVARDVYEGLLYLHAFDQVSVPTGA